MEVKAGLQLNLLFFVQLSAHPPTPIHFKPPFPFLFPTWRHSSKLEGGQLRTKTFGRKFEAKETFVMGNEFMCRHVNE